MKRELEKFIIWYIPFCLVTAAITTFLFPYLIERMVESHEDGDAFKGWLGFLVYFGSNCHKWVAAVWLWKQKKKENGRFVLWALFGFFQGLWAVAFYLGLNIFEEIKGKSKANIESLEQSKANKSVFTTPLRCAYSV